MATTVADGSGVRALLADGRVVLIRPLGPGDVDDVQALQERLGERDRYLRFFSGATTGLRAVANRIAALPDAVHAALGVYLDARLVGVASYEVLTDPTVAEVAFAVAATVQAHGAGTLLLEHLVSLARQRGVRRFVAEVLAENVPMLRVLHDSGLPMRIAGSGPLRHIELTLEEGESYLDALGERERVADTASLAGVLRPRSVAVVGASRSEASVGQAVLRNLLDGYSGELFAVNPHASEILGVPCVPSVAALEATPELAVLCLPAAAVPEVVEQCGQRGVRAVTVISAGLTGTDLGKRVLAAVHRYGMRLVGPNCVGVVNTEPSVQLNATFTGAAAPVGAVGVVTQSGGVGLALLEQLHQLGLGVSTLVSTGDKYDVSGNDLLLWWQNDCSSRPG